jgi:hypothetical protein
MPGEQNQQLPPSIQQEPTSNQVANPVPVQQPPSQPLTEQNTSGMGSSSTIPPGIEGWGWGPFFLTWIWGVFNRVWISLLVFVLVFIPFVNIVFAFILGSYGRKWAWQAKHWDSVEQFNKTQHNWSIAGILLAVVGLLLIPILAILVGIVIVAINPVERLREAEATKISSDVRQVDTVISGCIVSQTAMGFSADQTYSKLAWNATTKKGGCADSTTLVQGGYISSIPSGITITSGTRKICVYEATTNEPIQYASWDSTQEQVLTPPNGTTTCN